MFYIFIKKKYLTISSLYSVKFRIDFEIMIQAHIYLRKNFFNVSYWSEWELQIKKLLFHNILAVWIYSLYQLMFNILTNPFLNLNIF